MQGLGKCVFSLTSQDSLLRKPTLAFLPKMHLLSSVILKWALQFWDWAGNTDELLPRNFKFCGKNDWSKVIGVWIAEAAVLAVNS